MYIYICICYEYISCTYIYIYIWLYMYMQVKLNHLVGNDEVGNFWLYQNGLVIVGKMVDIKHPNWVKDTIIHHPDWSRHLGKIPSILANHLVISWWNVVKLSFFWKNDWPKDLFHTVLYHWWLTSEKKQVPPGSLVYRWILQGPGPSPSASNFADKPLAKDPVSSA